MATLSPRLRSVPVLLFVAAGLAAGCSGEVTSGGALDGGGPGGGDGDGGTRNATDARSSGVPGDDGGGRASDGGGGAPGCGTAVVCDDFEAAAAGGPPDPGRWSIATPDCAGTGALAVDDAEAHAGSRSVRIDGDGGYCNHIFIASDAIAGLGGAVHGRFWVRLADALGDGHVSFLAMLDARSDSDLRMGGQSRILMWNRESDDATLPELSPTGIAASVQPVPGVWTCIELAVDGAAGTITTSVDGAPVEGLVVDGEPTRDVDSQWLRDPDWRPDLSDIRLGWESYAGQAMTLWFDDVAFGPEPLGCD